MTVFLSLVKQSMIESIIGKLMFLCFREPLHLLETKQNHNNKNEKNDYKKSIIS